ncbi:hypothetical protein FGO68_gene6078 [Halteria grandinella]|uniref:Cyclic nucleotide-binding domain-containing protein n=1 Tax=Halteria grandinella TaxID=5974 RepID=A0A8J8T6N2_HALGN|nr:hypothetical protein FGO68_gene6078 [Halteria grandinella]
MKVSTLLTLKEDESIDVADYEALDFMVVIKGSITLEFDEGFTERLQLTEQMSAGGGQSPTRKTGVKMFPSPRRTPLVQQDYIWPVRINGEFDKLKKIRVTEGYDECLIMTVQRQSFRKLINSDRFVKENQINEWILKCVPGMDYFSSSQKRRIKDMLELEYYPKDQVLIKEGTINQRAYMIVKGEVELQCSQNLYTVSLQAKKNQDYSVMCQLYRNKASGYGNASNTIMTQHLGILSRGFWFGEEHKLVKNTYHNAQHEIDFEANPIFSPMIAILDLYFMSPLSPTKEAPQKVVTDPFAASNGSDKKQGGDYVPKPSFYTAVTKSEVLVFSIPMESIDRLPHDVFDSIRDNMSMKKLDMIFERLQFLHKQANSFMKHEGKMRQQEIEATFKHIKGIYPSATVTFQTKMRTDALKKAQMNPKILMMKKNERIDRNNTMNNTYDAFRSTNPRMRKEAAQFLERLRDPFVKVKHTEKEDLNNYEEICSLKTSLSKHINQFQKTARIASAARLAITSQERRASQTNFEERLATIESTTNINAREDTLSITSPAQMALSSHQESVRKQCQGFFSPNSTLTQMYESPVKKRETLVLSIDNESLRQPATLVPQTNAKYSMGRDMVGEHVIVSNTEFKGKTSPVQYERVQTAGQKPRMFINQTLNDFMNSDVNTCTSTHYQNLSNGASPIKLGNGLLSLHKHSKILNSQLPLAASNHKKRMRAIQAVEEHQKSQGASQMATYNRKLLDALYDTSRRGNHTTHKQRYERNMNFPLTQPATGLMLGSSKNGGVIVLKNNPGHPPLPPQALMSSNNIRDLIYGNEKKRVGTATTFKSKSVTRQRLQSPIKRQSNLNCMIAGSSIQGGVLQSQ